MLLNICGRREPFNKISFCLLRASEARHSAARPTFDYCMTRGGALWSRAGPAQPVQCRHNTTLLAGKVNFDNKQNGAETQTRGQSEAELWTKQGNKSYRALWDYCQAQTQIWSSETTNDREIRQIRFNPDAVKLNWSDYALCRSIKLYQSNIC